MKILLNCLPPTDVNSPTISLSILKKFMNNNGFETIIKYWNFSLSLMAEHTDSEDTEIRLIPFLSILNDKQNNLVGNARIISQLQLLKPEYKIEGPGYYSELLDELKQGVYTVIRDEISKIDFSEISLFGISAKYNQWIPGMILAEEIKRVAPHLKIIVGGFGSKGVAEEAMKLCPHFDYGTWGEGEYPLLELAKQLDSNTLDLSTVPRLIYREGERLIQSELIKSQYLDFKNYIYPDYDDFVNTFPDDEDKDLISIPINSIRSCHWRKCKFCDFNQGYKLRARTPECVVKEIEELRQQYGFTTFTFVDSDTFGNLTHFEKLLDLLIDLRYRTEEDYSFWAELIPNNQYNADLMQKMAIAGFKNLFIGYDGLSDALLSKMNKSNTFSDNVFFVKYSLKNGIAPVVNVIKHIPDETEADVQECIDNLHYLRFFYKDPVVEFTHIYVDLVLSSMSKYYSMLSEEERETYNTDDLSYMLPAEYSNHEDRFHLFRFKKDKPANEREWKKLVEVEEYYKQNKFSYKIQELNGICYYTEYCNDEEIENIVFGEPEYAFILKATEKCVRTFSELLTDIQVPHPLVTEERLKELLSHLKASYLIYCNAEYSNIISLIHL
ncbi:B12-binding domain-containing radical SAM protein [Carboxylicivirga sp. N1Y90]|uniref:B12-binding domain-containing radical SAM protein n=1 Tax=Carboxylicivirga fragile TaxID=3417571 RepID=UPI003D3315C0|nr:radical SAM protein [Marinilabiliaceae bacterium N1Y90]